MRINISDTAPDEITPLFQFITYSAQIADTGCGPFTVNLQSNTGDTICATIPTTVSVTVP